MTDLTQRIKSIESILSKNLLPLRGDQRVVTLSSPHSAPLASVTQDISYTRCCFHPYDTVPQKQPRPHRWCLRHFSDLGTSLAKVLEMLQVIGFLASLPPRILPDPMRAQFRLDPYCAYYQLVGHHSDHCTTLYHVIYDIIDFGMFGSPKSNKIYIPTSAQTLHANTSSLVVPDLIDLGNWFMLLHFSVLEFRFCFLCG